jgi:membrane associated rhomboid family serine protease
MPCEIVDHWRVWVLYITGAIWSAGFFYIFFPTGKLVGASGAIYAILATNIAEIIMVYHFFKLANYKVI